MTQLVALFAVLIVRHDAEPKPLAGDGARHVLCDIERLAGLRSALVATHHARDYARYSKESRAIFQEKA
jgi:hypothetical protein